jgi:hypothetical protein
VEQVRGKAVAKGVATSMFGDSGTGHSQFDRSLHRSFEQMMPTDDFGIGIFGAMERRKNILPTPFSIEIWVFFL